MFDNYKPRARARQLQLDKNNLNVDSIFQNSSLLTINNPKVRNKEQILICINSSNLDWDQES